MDNHDPVKTQFDHIRLPYNLNFDVFGKWKQFDPDNSTPDHRNSTTKGIIQKQTCPNG